MAHAIDMTTGKAAVFVTGEAAWHKLGKVVSEALTSKEAIEAAVLNWLVTKLPVYTDVNGIQKKITGKFAVVREDTGDVLGTVGSVYKPLQNHEAFSFMDALVSEGLARYETAGAIHGGKRIWVMARIPQEIRATDDDVVEPYALLTNSHDGTGAVQLIATSVRVVCQNTLNLALSSRKKGIKIRHSANMTEQIDAAREALGLVVDRVNEFQNEVDLLKSVVLTTQKAREYFEKVFPAPKKQKFVGYTLDDILDSQMARRELGGELVEAFKEEKSRTEANHARLLQMLLDNYTSNETNTMPGVEGTAWGAFNAVSYYTDHQMGTRGKTEADRQSNRLNSIWFGRGDEIKQTAFNAAMAMV